MLVEDDPDDQELARLANMRLDKPCRLVMVDDGVEALEYLERSQAIGAGRPAEPFPSLLLVDLDMPRMNGLDLLQKLRSNKALQSLPIIIFTTSKAARDVDNCYRHGCNSYVIKPMNISGFAKILESLSSYWFGCVKLPA
jgi:two-component system response regulator